MNVSNPVRITLRFGWREKSKRWKNPPYRTGARIGETEDKDVVWGSASNTTKLPSRKLVLPQTTESLFRKLTLYEASSSDPQSPTESNELLRLDYRNIQLPPDPNPLNPFTINGYLILTVRIRMNLDLSCESRSPNDGMLSTRPSITSSERTFEPSLTRQEIWCIYIVICKRRDLREIENLANLHK